MTLGSNALTSLDAAKAYAKIPADDTSMDALFEALINAASTAIDGYCRRNLKEQVYTDLEFDGSGSRNLLLGQYPISTISAVKIDDVLVDATEYKVRKEIGTLVRLNFCWPEGIMNLKVSFTAGYTDVPADLELACKHLVLFYYKTDIADFSRTFGEGFVMRPEAFPVQVRAILDPYRKVLI